MAPEKDKRIWRELVFENGGRQLAGSYAVAQGMVTLREDAWAKACAGLTTVEEILRVTQEDT